MLDTYVGCTGNNSGGVSPPLLDLMAGADFTVVQVGSCYVTLQ